MLMSAGLRIFQGKGMISGPFSCLVCGIVLAFYEYGIYSPSVEVFDCPNNITNYCAHPLGWEAWNTYPWAELGGVVAGAMEDVHFALY